MTDGTGSTVYAYDHLDNLTSVATTFAGMTANPTKTISYTYAPNGSRKAMNLPGFGVDYQYDALGRMAALSTNTGEYGLWDYYPNGWLQSQTLYGGRTTTYEYNARGFLTRLSNPASDYSDLTYDGVGNLVGMYSYASSSPSLMKQVREAQAKSGLSLRDAARQMDLASFSGSTTFSYAPTPGEANRAYGPLRQETGGPLGSRSHAYDAAYNPTKLRGVSGLPYNPANQRTGPEAFVYDHHGNPTTYKGATLSFDAENRLKTYGTFTGGYNGDGLRTVKQVGTTKTFTLYDGTDLVAEYSASGVETARNAWGANGLLFRKEGSRTIYYYYDPMGNVVGAHDQAWNDLGSWSYDAYGSRTGDTPIGPYGYGGQWGYYTDWNPSLGGLILCTHRYCQ